MRRLGIDYGRKRVGLALSDEAGEFAYPLVVFPNDEKLLGRIKAICDHEVVTEIILGQSLDFRRRQNPLMRAVNRFKSRLEIITGRPIIFEDETLTSKEAARQVSRRDKLLDARAAAIILRNYLARKK